MEKNKVFTLPLPIQECFDYLTRVISELGWQTVSADPETHSLWWRKGDDWVLKRRHDLRISLSERNANETELKIVIKDARIMWGGSELIAQDLDEVAGHIQANVTPIEP